MKRSSAAAAVRPLARNASATSEPGNSFGGVRSHGFAEQFGELDLSPAGPRAPGTGNHTQLFLVQDLRLQIFLDERRGYPTQDQVEASLAQFAKFLRRGNCLIDVEHDARMALQ